MLIEINLTAKSRRIMLQVVPEFLVNADRAPEFKQQYSGTLHECGVGRW